MLMLCGANFLAVAEKQLESITITEIEEIINILPKRKPPCPGGITNVIVKQLLMLIVERLLPH
jgi:hypothetical protein